MSTFWDLVQNDSFREFVRRYIAQATKNSSFSFSEAFPLLYKYRPLSEFAYKDILDEQITITSTGIFNDLFDGAIHQYGTEIERRKAAEQEWAKSEKLRIAANFPEGLLRHDSYVHMYEEHFKEESSLRFHLLDALGTYICCFSSKNDSTLMWSHYADSNTGICIEYDFNRLPNNHFLRKMLFPVAYTDRPIDLSDLLGDKKGQVFQYSIEAAILCAALNKATSWNYEKEWRLVCVSEFHGEPQRRMPMYSAILPSSICFGYHFLKPFFYYDRKKQCEQEYASKRIILAAKLLDYMESKHIAAKIIVPSIGSYELIPLCVDVRLLRAFIDKCFMDSTPEDIRYYHTIHKELMSLIEKEFPNA